MADDVTVQADKLTALVHEIVRLTGSDENECQVVAAHLVRLAVLEPGDNVEDAW